VGKEFTSATTSTDLPESYTWTNDNPSIGLAASGTGDIVFTPINATSLPIVANIKVTPVGAVSCDGTVLTFSITVNPTPATPTITAATATSFCIGGSVVLTSSSATGNQWYKDGGIIAGETNQTYTANTSGIYTVVLTASCLTVTSAGTTVMVNDLPAPIVSVAGATCDEAGTASINNYIAAQTYTFSPSGPSVGAGGVINGMIPGVVYTVSTSNGSCNSTPSSAFSIEEMLSPATAATVTVTVATCAAAGTATINNYVASNTYIFSPAGPSVGTGGLISGMIPGTSYTVITDNGSCSSSASSPFSIGAMLSSAVSPMVTVTAATCAAAGTATVNNYVANNTYAFSPAGPVVGAGGLITGMILGTSYIITTNNGSCSSSASSPFSIGAMLATPVATISYSPSEYQAIGTATVIQTGQTGGTYTASTVGLSINPSTGQIDLAASTPNQSYTVTYSFSNGSCTAATTTTVRINGRAATIAYANPAYCAVGTASVIRTGPISGSYTASPAGLSINSTTGEVNLASSKAGVYTITYSYQDGTITASSTTTITVNALPIVTITTDIPTGNSITLGDVVTLTATGGVTYSWSGDDIQSGQNTNVIRARPRLATTYKVTVTNANGCSETMEITINLVAGTKFTPNNVITPNGDGKNDVWVVKNLDYYPQNTVNVYDRAGRRVYSAKGYKNDWDGTYNGQPLAEGAYIYVIDLGAGVSPLRGTVNIIRDQR
jgi:gliding motility-associated-like protein